MATSKDYLTAINQSINLTKVQDRAMENLRHMSQLKNKKRPTASQISRIRELRSRGRTNTQIQAETGYDFGIIDFIILNNIISANDQAFQSPSFEGSSRDDSPNVDRLEDNSPSSSYESPSDTGGGGDFGGSSGD